MASSDFPEIPITDHDRTLTKRLIRILNNRPPWVFDKAVEQVLQADNRYIYALPVLAHRIWGTAYPNLGYNFLWQSIKYLERLNDVALKESLAQAAFDDGYCRAALDAWIARPHKLRCTMASVLYNFRRFRVEIQARIEELVQLNKPNDAALQLFASDFAFKDEYICTVLLPYILCNVDRCKIAAHFLRAHKDIACETLVQLENLQYAGDLQTAYRELCAQHSVQYRAITEINGNLNVIIRAVSTTYFGLESNRTFTLVQAACRQVVRGQMTVKAFRQKVDYELFSGGPRLKYFTITYLAYKGRVDIAAELTKALAFNVDNLLPSIQSQLQEYLARNQKRAPLPSNQPSVDYVLVTNQEQFRAMLDKLKGVLIVGLAGRYSNCVLSLLQVISGDHLFVIDVLVGDFGNSLWTEFAKRLEDCELILGNTVTADLFSYEQFNDTPVTHLSEKVVNMVEFWEELKQRYPHRFGKFQYCLAETMNQVAFQLYGRPVRDEERYSDYLLRPLNTETLDYAAGMAAVIWDVYLHLDRQLRKARQFIITEIKSFLEEKKARAGKEFDDLEQEEEDYTLDVDCN